MPSNYPPLWPIIPACDNWDSYDEEVQTRSVALASSTLERLTGYRVTMRTMTVRPCHQRSVRARSFEYASFANAWSFNFGVAPFLGERGLWVPALCECMAYECGCHMACSVELPPPIGAITEVRVDGNLVDPSTYRQRGSRLVYHGEGECPWPLRQNLALDDTEPGTFSITYVRGSLPDDLAASACGTLACEFAKALSGDKKCRLPEGVTSISRQGVTFQIVSGAFADGTTGIREVDAWIGTWNPYRLKQQPSVWSPDLGAR